MKTNIAGWNITIFNRKYIFNPGLCTSKTIGKYNSFWQLDFAALRGFKLMEINSNGCFPGGYPLVN